MKKIYFLLLALCFFHSVNAQIINFPSLNFKNKVLASDTTNQIAKNLSGNFFKIDANNDGQVEIAEAQQVSYLDISNSSISNMQGLQYFTNLVNLYCQSNNYISGNILDVSMMPNLQTLTCNNNNLSTVNVNGLTNLREIKCGANGLTSLDVSSLTNLEILRCDSTALTTLNLSGLTNLHEVHCFGSHNLTSINFTGCSGLAKIVANNCGLNGLNLAGLNSLVHLECSQNPFTILNTSNLPNLTYIQAAGGPLTGIDVSNCTSLYTLLCNNNQLTSVNLQNCGQLHRVNLAFNQLTTINLNDCINLYELDFKFNQLTTFDASNCSNLTIAYCSDNNLTSMLLKNGHFQTSLSIGNNPNLTYICCDDDASLGMTPGYGEQYYLQNQLNSNGITGCVINSYCSFVPGGTYYTVQGNSRFDFNGNGCDSSDIIIPTQRYNTSIGSIVGSLIANDLGNYVMNGQAGNFGITPVFEIPSYFTVTPPNAIILFPGSVSPYNQNFCVTANGVHPDLEVILLSVVPARPGFDAVYKMIYKNKGNTVQSGTVNVAFNDVVLDFVTSNPGATATPSNLSWTFTNLKPFEKREITLTLNVNSSVETPAVNGGDILNYAATISSAATDETPADNTFAFNQTVINSFDPNDKTCLEGATIPPSKVGDYVHYMIRFENTGTFPAENIVVKDIIDTNKFDISSIVPIDGSHDFFTKIEVNKVEFIFENINLPFDNANNDGYVAFKIKTKPTLVSGNTFSNSASIYFDYNFPIVTNTATTTVQTLGTQDFDFSNYFKVYPNPVSTNLNIETKKTIEISSISIYNTVGQLVLVVPNAQETKILDVSSLSSGNYFIKINSDKGSSNTKFIKQ